MAPTRRNIAGHPHMEDHVDSRFGGLLWSIHAVSTHAVSTHAVSIHAVSIHTVSIHAPEWRGKGESDGEADKKGLR